MRIRGFVWGLAALVVAGAAWAQTPTTGGGSATTPTTTSGDSVAYTPATLQTDFQFSTIPTASFKAEGKIGPAVLASAATAGLSFQSGTVQWDAEASTERTNTANGGFLNVVVSIEAAIGVAAAYSKGITLFGIGGGAGSASVEVAHDVVRYKDGVLTATVSDEAAVTTANGFDYKPLLNVTAALTTFNSQYKTKATVSVDQTVQLGGIGRFNVAIGVGTGLGYQLDFGF